MLELKHKIGIWIIEWIIKNAQVSDLVAFFAVIVTFLGFIVTIVVVILNLLSNKKNLYVNTISTERIKWLNSLREKFADYNNTSFSIKHRQDENRILRDNGLETKGYDLNEESRELIHKKNLIILYLNPSEIISKALSNVMVSDYYNIVNPKTTSASEETLLIQDKIMDIQQIILKSEWKRLKLEQEKGRELDEKEVKANVKKIACAISTVIYHEYFCE
ncbi:hypothetical protein [Alkalicoccobacillus plakortidis]|uniref:Uncharacterized protein n=1 Tax=Alkalicoccobacillus plakortidis TaxID=444060 RepID=A0ABT0XDV0_9BACI|nr:hypothetical protein [Alkalicoccobacillus plakortidis]MCM2674077.1 hypothetical protein [Alkalicoccobacillus plakortidis]